MLSTGMVRKVDELGRVVLPKELRDTMEIPEKGPLEVYVDENMIILKKYEPGCIFCGSVRDTYDFKGKNICENCKKEFKK